MENSLEMKESQRAIPWLLLIGIFCVVHLVFALLGPANIFDGELLGTDSYTRLNRVLFVHEQGHWNNSIYPRSNAPFGESIHWTKPMDLLLLAGGTFLALMMPFSTGLHVWGVVISPLLHVVAFLGIFCLMRENLDRLGVILLSIAFLLPPILTSYFAIGRPDHHSLILAVFCWFLAGLDRGIRKTPSWNQCFFIGVMGALGLWISVEFLVPICLFLAVYTIFWIWKGEKNACHISRVMTIMFLMTTVFLVLERPGDDLFSIEYDKISLPHCVVIGLIAVVWFGINQLVPHLRCMFTVWGRMGVIGMASIMACVVQWSLFPGFFHGPLVDLEPTFRQLIWDTVAEVQPLQGSEAIMNLGIGILVLPCLAYSMRQGNSMLDKYQGIFWSIGAGIFIPLALYESRWTPYASIILLIPYVKYVRRALEWAGTRWKSGRGEAVSLIFGLVLLFWPVTVGSVISLEKPKQELSTIGGQCPLIPLGEYLTYHEVWTGSPQTILAFKDFGPELLYRTPHQVVATPMHRNHMGFRDMFTIMTALDFEKAHQIVQRRKVNLIVVCVKSKAESEFFGDFSDEPTVHQRLVRGEVPAWVREVVLPENLRKSFKVFEVLMEKF